MPQLSPLNWVFLFALHWVLVLSLSVCFWWVKKSSYSFKTSKNKSSSLLANNKWSW
uniref:ATP synthase F0 subunit 8 n=1 Tax=Obscurella hidalgoi TaxID=1663726 RepID=A0A0M3WMD6_OBSHI|nr:ATP synthase F0 subunit 8 [Obscurella hidalgoi]AKL90681.1 ATP synthase F0 subunit 8 [Obscurella hidalgoi]